MLPNWLYGKSKSKLASILGSGGGAPADYDQVKAQVNQNTEGIALLDTQNQALANNVDVLIENGAINLLPIMCRNQTQNGVTLTNNNDGSVTINGTASENTYFYLLDDSTSHLENIEGTGKSYTLSGCTDGSNSTYALRMIGGTALGNWLTVGQIQTTEDMTFTEGAYTYYAVRLDVFSGASVNVTIKPMLVDSKYNGPYVPYAMTNRELTEENEILVDALTGDLAFSLNKITKKNGIVTINAAFQADKDYSAFTKFVEIPSGFRPIDVYPIGFLFSDTQSTIISVTAFIDGKIQASAGITAGEYYRLVMTYIIA